MYDYEKKYWIMVEAVMYFSMYFSKNVITHSVLPPLDRGGGGGGDDFCVISQAGEATTKLQDPGWGHIQEGR